MSIRILLADDHARVRRMIAALLGATADFEIVGEAADGPSTLTLTRALAPDVVVLDVRMPGVSGATLLQQLLVSVPRVRVVVLSQICDPAIIAAMLTAGASAYIVKDDADAQLVGAIRGAMEGTRFGCAGLSNSEAPAQQRTDGHGAAGSEH